MPEINLTTSINGLIVLGFGLLAFLVATVMYRFTVPPVPRGLKTILIILRSLGLFCIILLISEPLLSLLRRTTNRPTILLLADNSKSMTLRDRSTDRREETLNLLQSSALQNLDQFGDVRYGVFDTRTRFLTVPLPDSLTFSGEGTDIGRALKDVNRETAGKNIQALVLVTDGVITTGTNPLFEAEELGIPIFTIGIGDTADQQDVLVRKVVTNTITYAGNRVPVNVTISSSGYTNERVEVLLRDPSGILDRRTLTLQPGTREYAITMNYVAGEEGTRRMTVEVSPLPGEISVQNNRTPFFTKILRSKMKVTIVAGAPGPDGAFIRRILEQDENIEVTTFIERKEGQFYEGPLTGDALREADCIVTIGFPGPASSSSAVATLAAAIAEGKGLFFIMSRTVDPGNMRAMEPLLPVTVHRGVPGEQQFFLAIPERARTNAILKSTASVDVWAQLPPLFVSGLSFKVKPESEVLGLARIQSVITNEPLLAARNVNRRKSVALLGYGLWRWSMLSGSSPGGRTLAEEFLSNSIRWLTAREDDRPVRVEPVKELFEGHEPVEFTAQVYDPTYAPIDDAEIRVHITRGSSENQFSLTPLGNGRYEGSMEMLEEGDYSYSATVHAAGQTIAQDRGSFSVGGSHLEFQETRMNKLLLQQLAARTAGNYYESSQVGSLGKDIAALPGFQPREVVESEEIELWNKSWMLGAILLFFVLEWFLRKRSGML